MGNKTALVFLGVFFLLLFGLAATRVSDWDIFWQLQSGKYIWQTQSMIRTDTFTLAAATPRWEHCWLHDLIFYAVWSVGGYTAMSLLKGALIAATAVVLAAVAKRRGTSLPALLLVLPLAVLLTFGFWRDRPQLWSYLGFAVLLWLLEDFQERGGRRIFLLVPLVILWVNLHAGVLIVFPVLLAYLAAAAVEDWRKERSQNRGRVGILSLLFPLLAGALLLTPYGMADFAVAVKGAALGVASGSTTQVLNYDWLPWSWQANPFYLFAVVATALILLLGRSTLSLRDLLLLGGLALMGFRLNRHTPFFLLAIAAFLPLYVTAIGRRMTERWPQCNGVPARWAVFGLVLLLLLLPAKGIGDESGFFNVGLSEGHVPVAAAEFLRAEKLPGRIFNEYVWGGYLEWQLFPAYRVYWDARQSDRQIFAEGIRLMAADPDWPAVRAILDRDQIDVIVLPPVHYVAGYRQGRFLDPLRNEPDWALVFAGGPAVVFVRVAAVDASWLAAHRLPDNRIEDVIMELTEFLLSQNPQLYRANGERARIFLDRRDYPRALAELERYMVLCPPERRDAGAVRTYQALRVRQ